MIKVPVTDENLNSKFAYVIGWDRAKMFYAVLDDGTFTDLRGWQIKIKRSNKRFSLPYYPLSEPLPTRKEIAYELKNDRSFHKTEYTVFLHIGGYEYANFKSLKKAFSFIRSLKNVHWSLSISTCSKSSSCTAPLARSFPTTVFFTGDLPVSSKTIYREMAKIPEVVE